MFKVWLDIHMQSILAGICFHLKINLKQQGLISFKVQPNSKPEERSLKLKQFRFQLNWEGCMGGRI